MRRPWHILLVEDDDDDYVITRDLLYESKGDEFELEWFSTYESALEACIRNVYDACLVDYRLGEHDGLELARQAVKKGCTAPIILLTGQGSYEVDVEAMEIGVKDYLVKSDLNPALLERTIRYAIERKQSEEALRKARDELEIRVQARTQELGQSNKRLAMANEVLRAEIAERQRVEEALRKSENRFRKLAETTSSAIFIVQDFKIRYANPAVKMVTGFEPNELLNVEFWEIAHPAYQDALKRSGLASTWSSSVPARFELKLLTKRNEERWVDVTIGSLEFEGIQSQVVTAFDITERDLAEQALRKAKADLETRVIERTADLKQANEKLAQANQQLAYELDERKRAEEAAWESKELFQQQKALLESIFLTDPSGLAVLVGPELEFRFANPGYRALTSNPDAELVGKRFDVVWTPIEGLPTRLLIQQVAKTGMDVHADRVEHVYTDGTTHYFSYHIKKLPWKDEAAVLIVLWETTAVEEARRWAEEAADLAGRRAEELNAERAKLSAIIANAPEAIIVTDKESRVVLANPAAERLCGQPVPIGKNFGDRAEFQLYYPDGTICLPGDSPLVRSSRAGETLLNLEMAIIQPGERRRDLLVSSTPILDCLDVPNGAIAIFQDITQRKINEEEMRMDAAQIEVQHLLIQYREMERLHIAQDLHDGPLQELVGITFAMTDILQIASANSAQNKGLLIKLSAVQEQFRQQIRDLRVFCSELRPPTLVPFGLEKAIRSHAESFRERNPGLNIHLELSPDGQILPEKIRLALFRIYQELLINIVRHAHASVVVVHFSLNDSQVVLEVKDDGNGFEVPKTWIEIARQGHLGLVGVQERAEAAGGSMRIVSHPGNGTCVKVSIPRSSPQEPGLFDQVQKQETPNRNQSL